MGSFRLFPDSASTVATQVDYLYFYLVGMTLLGIVIVSFLVIYFGVRYRKERNPIPTQVHGSVPIEILWSVVPLGFFMIAFIWGAALYYRIYTPPPDAMDIYIVGKQWMWKAEHPTGQREINSLHVPINRPIRLLLISQDVFHSFSLPEMRIKREAIPGKYNTVWFEATKTGTFHIFCTQYCGTLHSQMIGDITTMSEDDYQNWLATGAFGSMAQKGAELFQSLGCITCHRADKDARAPNLAGLYGTQVSLNDGSHVAVDEAYVRQSILEPSAKIVAGFDNIMPTFQGQVSEDDLIELVEYIKSLRSNAQLQYENTTNQVGQPPAHSTPVEPAPGMKP